MSDVINGDGLVLDFSAKAILGDLNNGSARVMKDGASIYLEKSGITEQWVIVEHYSDANSRPVSKKFKIDDIKEAVNYFMK